MAYSIPAVVFAYKSSDMQIKHLGCKRCKDNQKQQQSKWPCVIVATSFDMNQES